jgi:hypothetical protein
MNPLRTSSVLAAIFFAVTIASVAQPAANDQSLTIERYMELGIPSPDRIWGAEEYAQTAFVLSSLPKDELPRFNSARSGALFARMVSTENLLPAGGVPQLVDSGQEVMSANMDRLVAYTQSVPPVLMLYIEDTPGVQRYSAEITRVSLYALQISRVCCELVDAILKPIPKKEQTGSAFASGRKQMSDGLNQMFNGLVSMVASEEAFNAADLTYLADGLRRESPPVFKYLNATQKKKVRGDIEKVAASHSNRAVRASLKSLLAATKK